MQWNYLQWLVVVVKVGCSPPSLTCGYTTSPQGLPHYQWGDFHTPAGACAIHPRSHGRDPAHATDAKPQTVVLLLPMLGAQAKMGDMTL